jgi:hypothetical protein
MNATHMQLLITTLTGEQLYWVKAVLCNDENSDDSEMLVYFVESGLTKEQAAAAIAVRGDFLRCGGLN